MSSSDTPQTPSRTASRRSWPVRLVALGSEPRDHLDRSITAEERLAMVWTLTVEAWALSGRAMPAYPRASTPVRLIQNKRAAGRLRDLADLERPEQKKG